MQRTCVDAVKDFVVDGVVDRLDVGAPLVNGQQRPTDHGAAQAAVHREAHGEVELHGRQQVRAVLGRDQVQQANREAAERAPAPSIAHTGQREARR